MKRLMGQMFAASAACCALMLSNTILAEAPASGAQQSRSIIGDIQLGQDGTLRGQVVNRQGQPVANREVTLLQGEGTVARATTDERGNFSVAGLRSGVYGIQSAGQTSVHRLWSANVAPPSAHTGVMLVSGPQAVRGQAAGLSGLGAVGAGAAAVGGYFVLDEYVLDDDKKPAS